MPTPQHLKRWTMPDNYAGAQFPAYFIAAARHRDSDTLTQSNFDALHRLAEETAKQAQEQDAPADHDEQDDTVPAVYVARSTHWAVGWHEVLLVHEAAPKTLAAVDGALAQLEEYPILDEEDYERRREEQRDMDWQVWARREFLAICSRVLDLTPEECARLEAAPPERLREIAEACTPGFDYGDDDGLSLADSAPTRDMLRAILMSDE